MIWKTALHYARFCLVLVLVSGHMSEEEKEKILELHNLFRSVVNPKAADMLHMTWDEDLSLVAKNYAEKCIWEHNTDVLDSLGENLFITTGPINVTESITDWFDENKHYDFDTNMCEDNYMCGHYTQVVWAKTTTVGCDYHFCKKVQNLHGYEDSNILVCNYFPPGNLEDENPYVAGVPCSECPKEANECIENTCVFINSTMEETEIDLSTTDTPQTKSTTSAGFIKLSASARLIAVLMVLLYI